MYVCLYIYGFLDVCGVCLVRISGQASWRTNLLHTGYCVECSNPRPRQADGLLGKVGSLHCQAHVVPHSSWNAVTTTTSFKRGECCSCQVDCQNCISTYYISISVPPWLLGHLTSLLDETGVNTILLTSLYLQKSLEAERLGVIPTRRQIGLSFEPYIYSIAI